MLPFHEFNVTADDDDNDDDEDDDDDDDDVSVVKIATSLKKSSKIVAAS